MFTHLDGGRVLPPQGGKDGAAFRRVFIPSTFRKRYAARFVLGTARFGRSSLRTRRGLSIVGASLASV